MKDKILYGNCRDSNNLDERMCVTSPPYYT